MTTYAIERATKLAEERETFRRLLWETVVQAEGAKLEGYTFEIESGESGYARLLVYVADLGASTHPNIITILFDHIGSHPMVSIGTRYQCGGERQRHGFKKLNGQHILEAVIRAVSTLRVAEQARHERLSLHEQARLAFTEQVGVEPNDLGGYQSTALGVPQKLFSSVLPRLEKDGTLAVAFTLKPQAVSVSTFKKILAALQEDD